MEITGLLTLLSVLSFCFYKRNSVRQFSLYHKVWLRIWKVLAIIVLTFPAFKSHAALSTPALFNPSAGATVYVGGAINFSWSAVSGATGYDLEFDAGTSYYYIANATGTSLNWPVSAAGVGPHTWQVRAKSGNILGPWSAARTYTAAFTPITLFAPASGSTQFVGTNINFSWTAITGATSYEFQFDEGTGYVFSTFPSSASLNWAVSAASIGTHTWHVRAKNGAVTGAWSVTQTYTAAYQLPTLSTPYNGSTQYVGANVTFNWSTVAGATGYELELDAGTGYRASTVTSYNTVTETVSAAGVGPHSWHVRAKYGSDAGPWSNTYNYTIAYQLPSLTSPANGSTQYVSSTINFGWTAVFGASEYEILFDSGTGYQSGTTSLTNSLNWPAVAGGIGNHTWQVRAKYGTAYGPWSNTNTYTIAYQLISLTSPSNGSTEFVGTNVTFSWTPVTGATAYDFEFDAGTAYVSNVTTTTNSLTEAVSAAGIGPHTWQVRAKYGSDYGPWTNPNNYTIAFDIPILTSPANNSVQAIGSTINFGWTAVSGATGYELEFDEGKAYVSTVSTTNNSFATSVSSVNVGTHTWQLRAKYGAITGPWSNVWTYSVPGITLSLNYPSTGFTAYTGTVLGFGWTDVGAVAYEIEFDAGTTYSSKTTSSTNTLDWPIIPAGIGTHTWHVRVNNGNDITPWSETRNYTVLTQPHVIKTPVNGVIKGYFPNYNDPNDLSKIQYDKLTDIFYQISFTKYKERININSDGTFTAKTDQLLNIINSQSIANGVNLYLCILSDAASLGHAIATPKSLDDFVKECAAFCANNSLAGIDMDWETPPILDNTLFKNLMNGLRVELDKQTVVTGKPYKISIAAPGYSVFNGISAESLQHIDYLNVMAYDDKPLTAGNNYNHSTYEYMKGLMDGWANVGVPYSKMVVGVPFYGRNQNNWDDASGFGTVTNGSAVAYESDTFTANDGKTYGYNGITTILKKMDYIKSKGCAGVFIWQLGHDAACPTSLLTGMSRPDPNEPNDDFISATPTFDSPVFETQVSQVLEGSIQTGSDQDWFKVPIDGPGTIKISLTGITADYDLELYPITGLAGGVLKRSDNTGKTTAETISYNYTNKASTIFYAKIYPKASNTDFDPCNKYTLTLTWTPAGAATCTTPDAPVTTFGADACNTPAVLSGTSADLSFAATTASSYQAKISQYPYGSGNIIKTTDCQTDATPFHITNLVPGMLYRWNMFAYGGTDCISCQSDVSNTKYFSLPPVISANDTQLPPGGSLIISTTNQTPGTGGVITYRWLKDGQPFQQGNDLASLTVTAPGTYSLINDFTGSTDCGGVTSTDPSNSIVVTAGTNCTASTAPTGIKQTVVGNTGSSPIIKLTLSGGSLGVNASWHWYASSCGGTPLPGNDASITITPSTTDDYFVRAESDCGMTECARTTVSVTPNCQYSLDPDAIIPSANNIAPGTPITLTVSGGELGLNGSWYLTTGSCGGTPAGSGRGGVFNLSPTVTTTYFLQAVGSCNTTNCVSVTVNVIGQPDITSFSPTSGTEGTTVTINGTNLDNATSVRFGSEPAKSFTPISSNTITAVVGAGSTGSIFVQTPMGLASKEGFIYQSFTFNPIPPQTYGTPDFIPDVSGNTTVSFSSDNASVAIVNSGKIHLAGVGKATITATDGNTTLTQELEVTPALLAITAADQHRLYGAPNPPFTANYAGFVNGENESALTTSPTLQSIATESSPAGAYPITASGATAPNYTINFVAGTLTIDPVPTPVITGISSTSGSSGAAITITGTNLSNATAVSFGGIAASSFTINSSTSITAIIGNGASGDILVTTTGGTAAFSGFTYQSFAFGPIPSQAYGAPDFTPDVTGNATVTFTSDNAAVATIVAGKIHPIGVGTATITATDGNTTVNQRLDVSPAILTITAADQHRFYGTANPPLTVTYSGFVNGENNNNLTDQPLVTTTATTSSIAGSYPITVSGATAANYTINFIAGTLTVDPVPAPVITGISSTSGPSGAAITIIGTNLSNATAVSFGGIAASSFTINSSTSITAIIGNGASGDILVTTAGGTAAFSGFTYQSFAFGPIPSQAYGAPDFTPDVTGNATVTFTSDNAAVATIVAGKIHLIGVGTATITATDGNTTMSRQITVTPAALTITANDQHRIFGTTDPVFTVTYTGFVNGEDKNVLTTLPTVQTSAVISSPAGTYPINASGAVAVNYTIKYIAGTLTIDPVPAPVITALSSLSGLSGTSITITWQQFSKSHSCKFRWCPCCLFYN